MNKIEAYSSSDSNEIRLIDNPEKNFKKQILKHVLDIFLNICDKETGLLLICEQLQPHKKSKEIHRY